MSWQAERFNGTIGLTVEESTPEWRVNPRPQEGSPNLVLIVLDDVGFAHLGSYGSDIATPNLDRLADRGLRYTNFHTTAMCSPTRSCLLTGRNHHTNGLGMISELAQGYPGYDGIIPGTSGLISEVLLERGYATFAVGKWHLNPAEESTAAGPFARWPLGRGFERFYGFLGGETNQFYPDLVRDNSFVDAPGGPETGYHLTNDLTDNAMSYIRDLRSVDPTKPFFLYFCPGACHAPHQAPQEYIDRYRGTFDAGWDAWREAVYQRQVAGGILPEGTRLSERPEWVSAWADLNDGQRTLYARMMEVFAGFLTHTDEQIGRLLACIESLGELDNTLVVVVSDNGTSGEGGFDGSINEVLMFNGINASLETNLAEIDTLGTEWSYGHYPTGWAMAGNTPFRRWKRQAHNGGIADPLIMSWPSGMAARGETRHQYLHAVDVAPAILDATRTPFPATLRGFPQTALAGESFAFTYDDPDAPSRRTRQYYEMNGCRAIYDNGWKAVTFHAAPPGHPADGVGDPNLPFMDDRWELYDLTADFSETHDLAATYPDKLQEMIALWFSEAGKYGVLPLHARQLKGLRPKPYPERDIFRYWQDTTRIDNEAALNVRMRPFSVLARVTIPQGGGEGVLIAQGGRFGGWSFFVQDGRLHFEHNYLGLHR